MTHAGPWPFGPGWMATCAWPCDCCSGLNQIKRHIWQATRNNRTIQASASKPLNGPASSPDTAGINGMVALAD